VHRGHTQLAFGLVAGFAGYLEALRSGSPEEAGRYIAPVVTAAFATAATAYGILQAAEAGIARLQAAASSSAAQGARLNAQFIAEEIAGGHTFDKHIGEFSDLGIGTRSQFASHIEDVRGCN
jgi:hypothetical protein